MSGAARAREDTVVVVALIHPPVFRRVTDNEFQVVRPAAFSWVDAGTGEKRYAELDQVAVEKKHQDKARAVSPFVLAIFILTAGVAIGATIPSLMASEELSVACPSFADEKLMSISIRPGETRCIYDVQRYGKGGSTVKSRRANAPGNVVEYSN